MDFSAPISTVIPGARGVVLAILAATEVPLTGSRIAELSGGAVSQSGVSKAMAPLVATGVVDIEHAGAANLYTLNRDHVAAAAVVAAASLCDELVARMAGAARAWAIRPTAVWLFGSVARQSAGPSSDVDVVVIRPDSVPEHDEDWEAQTMALADSVRRWSGNACEMLEYSDTEYLAMVAAGDRLVGEIRSDAIVLTGCSPRDLAPAR